MVPAAHGDCACAEAARRLVGSARQRGFTLVELAIALAVVGLVLGASLIPLRMLDEVRQVQDEQRRMEVVRDAVVGYALRHQTLERTLRVVPQNLPGSMREFRLPAGRPYLPCPDWDGDGFEDRYPEGADGFVQGMEVKPDLTVTATIQAFPASTYPFWFSSGYLIPGGYPYGECQTSRGSVPWRTLGIPPTDGWGSRHTYYADSVFSNAIFGFDRQTIADAYDPRVPKVPGLGVSRRIFAFITEFEYDARCPAVICDGGRALNCEDHEFYFNECMWSSRRDPDPLANQDYLTGLTLKAGAITKTGISAPPGGKPFGPGDVTDGLPFVIVSHGPNRRFAVNHWASLNQPTDVFNAKGPVCNLAGTLPTASLDVSLPREDLPEFIRREAVNGSRISSSEESCPRLSGAPPLPRGLFTYNQAFFVWEPPGIGDKSGFDDLLLWMTREELSLAVPGQIPPLPRMVVAYFP